MYWQEEDLSGKFLLKNDRKFLLESFFEARWAEDRPANSCLRFIR